MRYKTIIGIMIAICLYNVAYAGPLFEFKRQFKAPIIPKVLRAIVRSTPLAAIRDRRQRRLAHNNIQVEEDRETDFSRHPLKEKPEERANDLTLHQSRYGNPSQYHVDGKQYEVSASSKGYKAQGLASWYGKDFHKERTSSGETYDMYGMTAAHKTLPLPTLVRVTNLENKRHVVVKVNDRGPFHEGRIIDLSYAAAKALQLDKKGVGMVEVESLTDKNAPDKHWFLQVGAFEKVNKAREMADYLTGFINLPIAIIKDKGANLVQIGPLQDKIERQALTQQLFRHGIRDMFAFIR